MLHALQAEVKPVESHQAFSAANFTELHHEGMIGSPSVRELTLYKWY